MSIRVTQGDTTTLLVLNLYDYAEGNRALDVSAATVRMRIRPEGSTSVATTLTATLLAGLPLGDGTFDMTSTVPGAGGRVRFTMSTDFTYLDVGRYLGEIEIQYPTGGVQTAQDTVKLNLVAQF